VGPRPPLRQQEVWSIWIHLQMKAKGQVVGHGSLELENRSDTNAGFQLFLILRWLKPGGTRIADEILARLRQDVAQLEIVNVWVREYANDQPSIDFPSSRGFQVTMEYEFGGHELVNLEATCHFFAAGITIRAPFVANIAPLLCLDR